MKLADPTLLKSRCFINGQWHDCDNKTPVYNPANGELITRVASVDSTIVEEAISDAKTAFDDWRHCAPQVRSDHLMAWFEQIAIHRHDLATIITLEQGKPLSEALAEIDYAASYIRWFAQQAVRIEGELLTGMQNSQQLMVSRDPVGVCAAIAPWNFPAAMITRKVAPALAAGCTMVVKPAQQTPLTALALAELASRAGLPKGVLQVVCGDPALIGEELTRNPTIRKLSFTGSTRIGSLLMQQCAKDIKKLSLELGGNAPFIVFEDTDLTFAAGELIKAKFRNAGQTCISPNRVYVQDAVYSAFALEVVRQVKQLKVGDGFNPDTTVGPLIDDNAATKVRSHIQQALDAGARMLCGETLPASGRWVAPTVLTDVPQDALCCCEETFGPLVPLIRFDSEQQVTELANGSEFGLAAYLFSNNIHRVRRVVDALETGMVGVNTGVISAANAPFGGVKASGIGREGAHVGIEEYLEMKYQCYGNLPA